MLFLFYEPDFWGFLTGPFLGVMLAGGEMYYVSSDPVSASRAVVVGDGEMVLFIDANNNLRLASLDPASYEEKLLTYNQVARAIAGSRDGRYLAYTTTAYDNFLYLLDLLDPDNPVEKTYRLYMPAFDVDEPAGSIKYSDVIEFTLRGDKIIFDAVFEIMLPDSRQPYQFWNIGILDIASGKLDTLIPVPRPGIHLGNPAAAQTRNWLIAMDVVDERENTCQTYAVNILNGALGLIASQKITPVFGRPSFSGDDTFVALQCCNGIYKVPLVPHPENVFAGDTDTSSKLVEYAYYPQLYRIGGRDVRPQIHVQPSSVSFGTVRVGQRGQKKLTIANEGNYPLTVDGLTMATSKAFSHTGAQALVQPNSSLEFTVYFTPEEAGERSTTLTINSDDPRNPKVQVHISGTGEMIAGALPYRAVTGISLDKTIMSLAAGVSATLQASIEPVAATDQSVYWRSSNEATARVNSRGEVTAVAPGNAVISVTTRDGERSAYCNVTVTGALPPAEVVWEARTTHNPLKPWQIRFSHPLQPESVNKENIKIMAPDPAEFDYHLELGDDEYSALIRPSQPYRQGITYTLYISNQVKSKDGRSLTRPVRMDFSLLP